MQHIQIDDEVFKAAQRRATEGGYPSVDAYITDIVVHDLTEEPEETTNLDHLFTPEVIAELDQISENIKAGGKTYTVDEVDKHFEQKRQEWLRNHAS